MAGNEPEEELAHTKRDMQNWMKNHAMPNSAKNDFRTPEAVFKALNERFGPFTLDAAASKDNACVDVFYSEDDNGLEQPWTGFVFCNPPYVKQWPGIGRGDRTTIKDWVQKGLESVLSGQAQRVVILIPNYSSVAYWHDDIFPHISHLVIVKGRIDFTGPHIRVSGASRNPSVAIVFSRMWSGCGMQVMRLSNKGEWLTEECWDRETLQLKLKNGVEAFGHELEGSKFVVLKGSTANREPRPSWRETERRWRKALEEDGALVKDGEHMRFTRDVTFMSPSAAASTVRAVQSNGRILWKATA